MPWVTTIWALAASGRRPATAAKNRDLKLHDATPDVKLPPEYYTGLSFLRAVVLRAGSGTLFAQEKHGFGE